MKCIFFGHFVKWMLIVSICIVSVCICAVLKWEVTVCVCENCVLRTFLNWVVRMSALCWLRDRFNIKSPVIIYASKPHFFFTAASCEPNILELPPFDFWMCDLSLFDFWSYGDCGQLFDELWIGLRIIVGMRDGLDWHGSDDVTRWPERDTLDELEIIRVLSECWLPSR